MCLQLQLLCTLSRIDEAFWPFQTRIRRATEQGAELTRIGQAFTLLTAGIGFSAHGVKLDRLPGWEPHSYGYHGDDGMAFQSCGTGKPYGPIFATG